MTDLDLTTIIPLIEYFESVSVSKISEGWGISHYKICKIILFHLMFVIKLTTIVSLYVYLFSRHLEVVFSTSSLI